jgi:Effector-associated domain 1
MADFFDSFVEAFNKKSLEQLLQTKLDKRLGDITGDDGFRDICVAVFAAANEEGWYRELIVEAKAFRPENEEFQRACDDELATLSAPQLPPPPGSPTPYDWTPWSVLALIAVFVLPGIWLASIWSAAGLIAIVPAFFAPAAKVLDWRGLPRIWRKLKTLTSKRWVFFLLAGVVVLEFIGSLFAGTVHTMGLPSDAGSETIRINAGDLERSQKLGGYPTFLPTIPGAPREAVLRVGNYRTNPIPVKFWRKQLVWADQFAAVPHVLFTVPKSIKEDLPKQGSGDAAWKLEINIGDTQIYDKEYYGAPILLGSDALTLKHERDDVLVRVECELQPETMITFVLTDGAMNVTPNTYKVRPQGAIVQNYEFIE